MKGEIIELKNIHKVKEDPGIYSWHIKIVKESDMALHHDLFKSKRFDAELSGNFSENYKGSLKSIKYEFDYSKISYFELMTECTYLFCPPLYIGISNNLNKRLNTHLEQLKETLYETKFSNVFKVEDIDIDSEKESKYFGIRVGYFLKDDQNFSINSLYLKILYVDNNTSRSELLELEKFFNRTYTPLFGRK